MGDDPYPVGRVPCRAAVERLEVCGVDGLHVHGAAYSEEPTVSREKQKGTSFETLVLDEFRRFYPEA